MQRIKNSLVLLLPVALLMAVTYLSLAPMDQISSGDSWLVLLPYIDKIVHFCFYLSLAGALRFALTYLNRSNRRNILYVLLFCICYGGIIELLQGAFFHRSCNIFDFFANTTGALTALYLVPAAWYRFFVSLIQTQR